MLNLFRRGGVVQVIMGGVVLLIIAAFAITMGGPRGAALGGDQVCVAKVDGVCLSQTEYDANYRMAVMPGVSAKQLKALGFPKDVLDGLIERELLYREAQVLKLSVSDEKVDDELFVGHFHYSLPVERYAGQPFVRPARVTHSKTGQFDYKLYKREVLNLTRMTPKEFKDRQQREIVADRLRRLVMSQVRVSDGDAFAEFQREHSKLTADVANVETRWIARYAVVLDKEALDAFESTQAQQIDSEWKKIQGDFKPGCALVGRILVPFEPGLSDEDKQEKRARIDAAKGRLALGEDFARLAREYGSDAISFAGGTVGCLGATEGDKPLVEAVAKLSPGQVSDVVETEAGYHLLRIEGTVGSAQVESLGRGLAASRLAWMQAAGRTAEQFARELIERASGETTLKDALSELARSYVAKGLGQTGSQLDTALARALADPSAPQISTEREFNVLGNPVRGAKQPGVASLAFAVEAGGVVTTPIETDKGFAVLEVTEKNLTTKTDFEAQRLEIKKQMRLVKAAEALNSFVLRLRREAEPKIEVNDAFLAQVAADADKSDG